MEPQAVQAPATDELLTYLYPKKFTCTVCENEFTQQMVRKTKLKVLSVDTDFKSFYKDIDPNRYEVMLCKHCGFAALPTHFDKIVNRQREAILQKIKPEYKHVEYELPYSVESTEAIYGQAYKCAEAMNAKVSVKAFLSLRLAWVFREVGRKDDELKYIKVAYEGLKEAYSTENFPLGNMDESTAKYVIGDLARRLGLMGEAMRWIADVVVAKGISQGIKEKAVQLKDLIREGSTT